MSNNLGAKHTTSYWFVMREFCSYIQSVMQIMNNVLKAVPQADLEQNAPTTHPFVHHEFCASMFMDIRSIKTIITITVALLESFLSRIEL